MRCNTELSVAWGMAPGSFGRSSAQAAAASLSTSAQLGELAARVDECEARIGTADGLMSGIDLSKLGTGKAKTLEQLAAEMQHGKSVLMLKEDASGRCQPVRVVDTVLLKLYSTKSRGKLLIETSEASADGKKYEGYRLPNAKKEKGEHTKDTVLRIQKEVLRMEGVSIHYEYDQAEVSAEEKDSSSYPGIRTLYRMETVTGILAEPEAKGVGLEGDESWTADNPKKKITKFFKWMTKEQASDKVMLEPQASNVVPRLLPVGDLKMQGALAEGLSEINRSIDAVFHRDAQKFAGFVRNVESYEAWQSSEHASVTSIVQHQRAKRQYVARHASQLMEFASTLREVDHLVSSINPPQLQLVVAQEEQLRRLEVRSAVAAGAAARLHETVARVAEDYHKAMVGLNAQVLEWDSQLSSRVHKGSQ